MRITYYGHSCFGIEVDGKHLLFDPFITPNEKADNVNINEIKADFILLSHAHEDHLADLENIAKRTGAKLISNNEIVTWYGNKGIQGHPMNHGGSWEFEFGIVRYVNAIHSSVLPDGTYGGNPGGFVIETPEGNFYYAGDTALTYDMKIIGEMYPLDFAILPVGDNFTMGIRQAIKCAEFINCNEIIPMHYDTFGYIEIDHEVAKKKFSEAGLNLKMMRIGETTEIGEAVRR